MGIYIFSRPVHSGKTSALLNWSKMQQSIGGILMPDIDGIRRFYNMETGQCFDAECISPAATQEQLTSVGRFHFYTAAFEKANDILLTALSKNFKWLLVDEAGKLEVDGKGLYRAIVEATVHYDNSNDGSNLLITVRDSLCEKVIGFFNITHYKIINDPDEITRA